MNTKTLKSSSMLKFPFSPILAIIIIAVICELLIMAVLESFSIHNVYLSGYLDTILLLILLTSLLYFMIIRPKDIHIAQINKVKEELFEAKEHYRALSDLGEALIWKSDHRGKCIYGNYTWLNFTGRTLEQELGDGWMDEIHPDDLAVCLVELSAAFEQKEKVSIKYRLRHASGQYRWIQNNGAPTFTSKGEFNGYIGHCLDIHEFKMMEENIKKREKEYRTLFEYAPIAAMFADRKGTIIFWNKEAEKTLGWAREETIGKSFTHFFKPDYNHPEVDYNIEELFDNFNSKTIIKEYVRKDKTTIICEWHSVPVYGLDGKIKKVISIAKDITEQKRYERQLIVAKEKAEESERLKSAFLANMTHELRSPLTSIIGFSELLADPGFDAEQKTQFAQLINSGGKNLLETINELMDFSKIEAGQIKVNKQPLLINKLLSDLQLEYSFKARQKGVHLLLDADNPCDDIVVSTDEIKIRQVLVNFISNALKFTAKGSIELGLRATDSHIQLHVRDTGIGIPQEYREKIFERFLQVHSPNTGRYGGIGLGLAISKSLVELLGGNIWVESQEGIGSTFFFTLPLEGSNEQAPATDKITEQPTNAERWMI